ncbi:uncharacterized protein LOC113346087 [Papaver somniferum]|uniref:uncharacterized protein LOC113346087 n=1 Tax=Papaver somniferum TaxID=3469 RepID=UPI000E6F6406|nr:uncharacterized protein LOC113346087 [Papaver somniferum]
MPAVELDEEHDTLEALLGDEELDVLPESTNLRYHCIHDLPVEDDYHSGNSSSFEDDEEGGETDTDLDEEEPYRYEEGKIDHNKYDDLYDDVEGEEVEAWTCDSGEEELKEGMTWPTMDEYKIWLTKFCIANCIEVRKIKDDPKRLRCQCKVTTCPFRRFAHKKSVKDGTSIKVTKYINKHTCVNRSDGYKWLPEVLEQIKAKNRGSIGVVATDMDKDFSYCCLAFNAYLEGFKNGCRPFIGLDGCHLSGKYGGVMLSAVALDGNNGMYPLEMFFCDCENKKNWLLFLNLIKDRILEHPAPLTFISDRQKGLIPALEIVFPSNRTRFCFRHMYENFKTKHKSVHMKNLAWGASKAYRDTDHKRYMALMKKDNKNAHKWFEDVSAIQWARSTFDHTSKCDHVTNNFSESFNSWSLDVRCKPIQRILEGLNLKMMSLIER